MGRKCGDWEGVEPPSKKIQWLEWGAWTDFPAGEIGDWEEGCGIPSWGNMAKGQGSSWGNTVIEREFRVRAHVLGNNNNLRVGVLQLNYDCLFLFASKLPPECKKSMGLPSTDSVGFKHEIAKQNVTTAPHSPQQIQWLGSGLGLLVHTAIFLVVCAFWIGSFVRAKLHQSFHGWILAQVFLFSTYSSCRIQFVAWIFHFSTFF